MPVLVRRAFALFFVAHGIAHLVGFMAAWRLNSSPDAPAYTTLILNGTVDVGDAGMRLVGLLWIVGAISFFAAAVALWRGNVRAVAALTVVSLAVCVLGLPMAIVGVVIDVAVLLVLGVLAVTRPVLVGAAG